VWLVVRVSAANLTAHWALATFSIAAAVGIWFIIQDVDNPRVEGIAPPEGQQAIEVEFVNGSPDYIPKEAAFVRVRVEAREQDLPGLRAGDFRATIDLKGLTAGNAVDLPVTVQSRNSSVRVIGVEPSTVLVELEAVERKEVRVTVNVTAPPLDGYELVAGSTVVEPAFVTVSGRKELVDNVATVEIDANLSGKTEGFSLTRDLVARSLTGQEQQVALSATEAKVTFTIEQRTAQRDFAVVARVSGEPAAGYHITGISVEPKIVRVTGPKDIVDGLTELIIEPVDVGGATTDINREKAIQRPQNVSLTPEEVQVTVTIEPIQCGGVEGETPCQGQTFVVGISPQDVPQGLTLAPGAYSATIQVTGPLALLAQMKVTDVQAVVSLKGAVAGTAAYPVAVTVPAGVAVAGTPQAVVSLISVAAP